MRKKLLISLLIVALLGVKLDVNADNAYATSSDSNYNTLKNGYNNNTLSKVNVSSSNATVTLYGKSECSGSSCTYNYAGSYKNFKDALSQAVVCSNGEKYISYQTTGEGGKTNYMDDNKANYTGTVYWSEDYYVTCTNNNGGDVIETSNDTTTTTGTSSGTTTTKVYSGTTTTENPQTGVNTYFIVLGLIAVISYGFMVIVKKYNLFKKI